MLEHNIKRKGDFNMSSIEMWNIFENTGNIEAYLYDKINRELSSTMEDGLALKDAILNSKSLQQKDGTEG